MGFCSSQKSHRRRYTPTVNMVCPACPTCQETVLLKPTAVDTVAYVRLHRFLALCLCPAHQCSPSSIEFMRFSHYPLSTGPLFPSPSCLVGQYSLGQSSILLLHRSAATHALLCCFGEVPTCCDSQSGPLTRAHAQPWRGAIRAAPATCLGMKSLNVALARMRACPPATLLLDRQEELELGGKLLFRV